DPLVTGVQTCALPISWSVEMRKVAFRVARALGLGSIRVPRVGRCVSRRRTFRFGSSRKRDTFANTRGGCAPRNRACGLRKRGLRSAERRVGEEAGTRG